MLTQGSLEFLNNTRILITGGTGSLGNKLTRLILDNCPSATIVIYSRDEFKQFRMKDALTTQEQRRLRFFLGDVRDKDRLLRAFKGVHYVIHAAALKHVTAAEYNPFEFIQTNIIGAENVVNAAIDCGVKKVVALSTDKAADPINLYGATKLCSDKLFVAGNSYGGSSGTRFAVVRYGNVMGSRGSVVPIFLQKYKSGVLPITDIRMTRFWITLDQGAHLVLNTMRQMQGGEIYVPKIPSMRMIDLAKTIDPNCRLLEIGIRPGEKLHEVMIPSDIGRNALEYDTHFLIQPNYNWWSAPTHRADGTPCPPDFCYRSDLNSQWLSPTELRKMILNLDLPEVQEWALTHPEF
jgi:UDP-N-acetylglucosamine 4,6-dehydratase